MRRTWGSPILTRLCGRNVVHIPEVSVRGSRHAVEELVGDRPDALIVDFFAGSGTTFQAVCMLNESGRRSSSQRPRDQ